MTEAGAEASSLPLACMQRFERLDEQHDTAVISELRSFSALRTECSSQDQCDTLERAIDRADLSCVARLLGAGAAAAVGATLTRPTPAPVAAPTAPTSTGTSQHGLGGDDSKIKTKVTPAANEAKGSVHGGQSVNTTAEASR